MCLILIGNRLILIIQVWGLTCECGFVEPETTIAGYGACKTKGPATGWTHENVTKLGVGNDESEYRKYVVDVRTEKFKNKQ